MTEKSPSRRALLKSLLGGAAVGAGLVAAGMTGAAIIGKERFAFIRKEGPVIWSRLVGSEADTKGAVEEAQEFILQGYGIPVSFYFPKGFYNYSGTPLTQEESRLAMRAVMNAMAKYPADFFTRNRIERIYIVRDLAKDGQDSAVAGMAASDIGTLFLEYDGEHALPSLEYGFHHEMYHLLDYRDGGYEQVDSRHEMEVENRFEERHSLDRGPYASAYAMKGPNEDRAEMGAHLLFPHSHDDVITRIASETDEGIRAVLQSKVDARKEEYFRWSGGAMDERFWTRIREAGMQERVRQETTQGYYVYESPEYYYGSYSGTGGSAESEIGTIEVR